MASLACTMASQQGCDLDADWARLHQALVAEREAATDRAKTPAADRCTFKAPNDLSSKKQNVFQIAAN